MEQKFDLFKLHSKEDAPKGWIWVYFNPSLLKDSYHKLLKNESQKNISTKIKNNLNCGLSTIQKHLIKLECSKHKIWLPLPLVKELLDMSNGIIKDNIISGFEFFICKNRTAKQATKAVKFMNVNLAKIIGAHIADGYLQKEGSGYKIKISDGRKDLVEKCAEWIKEVFFIKSRIRFDKIDNTWNCWFNNKVVGRYFENLLEIKSGKKFDVACEPILIKNSDFRIRKAFASGVIMFDGGVESAGTIGLTSMSKQLINDIFDILLLDGIDVNKRYNLKKKSWSIESKTSRNKEHLTKWLDYFEKGTWKYRRLKFFLDREKYNIDELNELFPKHHRSKISLREIYNIIKSLNSTKIQEIINEINKKDLKIAKTTIYKYLYLLERSSLIYKEMEKHTTQKNGWREAIYSLS